MLVECYEHTFSKLQSSTAIADHGYFDTFNQNYYHTLYNTEVHAFIKGRYQTLTTGCKIQLLCSYYLLPDDAGSSMNQNLHVRLRGPLGHLTLKAVMMINRGTQQLYTPRSQILNFQTQAYLQVQNTLKSRPLTCHPSKQLYSSYITQKIQSIHVIKQ